MLFIGIIGPSDMAATNIIELRKCILGVIKETIKGSINSREINFYVPELRAGSSHVTKKVLILIHGFSTGWMVLPKAEHACLIKKAMEKQVTEYLKKIIENVKVQCSIPKEY